MNILLDWNVIPSIEYEYGGTPPVVLTNNEPVQELPKHPDELIKREYDKGGYDAQLPILESIVT